MRTVISFVIVILVLNAAIRGGTAYWKYYQFKDAAQEIALFSGSTPQALVHQQVMDKADKLEIVLGPDDVAVVRDGSRTEISASFVQQVEFIPRYYTREIPFRFVVESTATNHPLSGAPPSALPAR